MRVYLEALGCRLNYAEMSALGRQLTGAGHVLASSADQADICVLNTCAVTGDAARKSRQFARQLTRANPDTRLVVTGCYATLEGQALAALPGVALVVGNERKERLLAEICNFDERLPACDDARGLHGAIAPGAATRTRAFVKVQDGCNNRCTFCIVTMARGAEHSRPIREIIDEIDGLHREGCQEAVITGVHLGAYGRDLGIGLESLIYALLERTSIPRLRLSSLEPFDLQPGIFALWSKSRGRLMPHLHLPAQSGSDAVLRRMARRNSAAEFEALAQAARAAIPGLTITTDLIAGFPGETETNFADTLAFAGRVGFAHIHVFTYSARAGTAAASFAAQVPQAERKQRSRMLGELDSALGRAVRRSFLGDKRAVLWEKRISEPGGAALWTGLTDNYLRVQARAPAGQDLHNCIGAARLVRLDGDGLWADMV